MELNDLPDHAEVNITAVINHAGHSNPKPEVSEGNNIFYPSYLFGGSVVGITLGAGRILSNSERYRPPLNLFGRIWAIPGEKGKNKEKEREEEKKHKLLGSS